MIEMVDSEDSAEEGEIVAETAEQLAAARRNKKEEKNKPAVQSTESICNKKGFVDIYGTSATAGVEIKTESAIRIVDVQSLVLWTLAEAINPRWVFLKVYGSCVDACMITNSRMVWM